MKKWISFLLAAQLLVLSPMAFAEDDIVKNTQDDLLLLAAAGGGGAILGLSTLSFYDEPAKHISNIWTGAAIGLIAGVVWVAYSSAQKGSEELVGQTVSSEFKTSDRLKWHRENTQILSFQSVQFGTEIYRLSF